MLPTHRSMYKAVQVSRRGSNEGVAPAGDVRLSSDLCPPFIDDVIINNLIVASPPSLGRRCAPRSIAKRCADRRAGFIKSSCVSEC